MTRRRFLAAFSAAPRIRAQTRAEKGKQCLDEVIGALGGPSILNMQNRVETGRAVTLYRDQLTGLSQSRIYTEYLRTPEPGKLGVHERQFFGKKQDSSALLLDGKGYDISYRGARMMTRDTLERYYLTTRHNFFYILRQRLKEPDLIVELTGHEAIENQSTDVIDFYDANNENVTVWVNSFTHLPVRQRWYRREKGTGYRYEEITHYSKYRESGGIHWPRNFQRDRDGERIAEVYDDDVKFNVALKEDIFTLPPGVKMLTDSK
jgi:hypothetical protein